MIGLLFRPFIKVSWDRINSVHPRVTVRFLGIVVAKQYWNTLGNIWVSELPHYGIRRRLGLLKERIKVWVRSRK